MSHFYYVLHTGCVMRSEDLNDQAQKVTNITTSKGQIHNTRYKIVNSSQWKQ